MASKSARATPQLQPISLGRYYTNDALDNSHVRRFPLTCYWWVVIVGWLTISTTFITDNVITVSLGFKTVWSVSLQFTIHKTQLHNALGGYVKVRDNKCKLHTFKMLLVATNNQSKGPCTRAGYAVKRTRKFVTRTFASSFRASSACPAIFFFRVAI